jgi:hypothetical protein
MSSRNGPCHTIGFASVLEGAVNQVHWREVVVVDLVWEAEPLPVWETELLPGDTRMGENTSLIKREFCCFVASGNYSHIALGVRHVKIFIDTHIGCSFFENPFGLELGLGIGVGGLCWGFTLACWGFTPTCVIKQF